MKKVLLGMSGGVDSSVAALLLKNKGFDVVGATFKLWKPENENSGSEIIDAKKVCEQIGIEHVVLDFEKEFKEKIVDEFALKYQLGKTPSPCILCNQTIKFGLFYYKAMELGFDAISTGHYAKIIKDEENDFSLHASSFKDKDQSYFLYGIPNERLENIIFPLEQYSKDEVRKIALDNNLVVAKKSDSQEICFIKDKYTDFLIDYIGKSPEEGDFVDKNGNILGRHKGIWYYTVGQRKGLGVAFGKPMFVTKIIAKTNCVEVAEYEDTFENELTASSLCWQMKNPPNSPFNAQAKIRSRAPLAEAVVTISENSAKVSFSNPQKGIASGQSVVFYDGDKVLGGGIID